jgi:hypothetical protein
MQIIDFLRQNALTSTSSCSSSSATRFCHGSAPGSAATGVVACKPSNSPFRAAISISTAATFSWASARSASDAASFLSHSRRARAAAARAARTPSLPCATAACSRRSSSAFAAASSSARDFSATASA